MLGLKRLGAAASAQPCDFSFIEGAETHGSAARGITHVRGMSGILELCWVMHEALLGCGEC